MPEVKGPLWAVQVVLMDRWSGPETLERRVFTSEEEAKAYAKGKDERGIHASAPECYVAAWVEEA